MFRKLLYTIDLLRSGEYVRTRYYKELCRSQFLPRDELENLQLSRLKLILDYAWKECPFYQSQMRASGIIPSDIKQLEDIRILPILTRTLVQQHREELIAQSFDRRQLLSNQTGGSTGEPVCFYLSRDRYALRAAATRRHNEWAGWRPGSKVAAVWGAAQDVPANSFKQAIRNKLIDRQLLLDASKLGAEVFTKFDRELKAFKPDHILAYAKSLALFARFLASQGITPFQPKSIITSAEMLTPEDRQLIESTFGCAIFNRYGCREFSIIASECSCHRGMHQCAEHLLVEIDEAGNIADGDSTGAIVVTDLMNLAMPMIRYRIGDLGAWDETACECGRNLPLLKNLSGRITDFIVGEDGRLISGVFLATYVIAKFPSLGRVQLRQFTKGEIVYLVTGKPDSAILDDLARETKKHLGSSTKVLFDNLPDEELSSTGKHMYCKSDLALSIFA